MLQYGMRVYCLTDWQTSLFALGMAPFCVCVCGTRSEFFIIQQYLQCAMNVWFFSYVERWVRVYVWDNMDLSRALWQNLQKALIFRRQLFREHLCKVIHTHTCYRWYCISLFWCCWCLLMMFWCRAPTQGRALHSPHDFPSSLLEIITSTAQATLISLILSQFPWKRQPISSPMNDGVKYWNWLLSLFLRFSVVLKLFKPKWIRGNSIQTQYGW